MAGYYIGVTHRAQVAHAAEGGFVAFSHGRESAVQRLNPGDRVNHWLRLGAQPTDRIARLLEAAGARPKEERNNPQQAVPGENATTLPDEKFKNFATPAPEAATALAVPAVTVSV